MCCTRRGGPRTPSTTTDANLDCAFVENALFLHRSLILKSHQNRIELVTRPATRLPVLPPRGEVVQLRIEPVAPQCGLCGMRNRKNFYCVSCVQKGDFIHSGRGRGAGQQTLNPHGNLAEKKCNALRQAPLTIFSCSQFHD